MFEGDASLEVRSRIIFNSYITLLNFYFLLGSCLNEGKNIDSLAIKQTTCQFSPVPVNQEYLSKFVRCIENRLI